MELGKFIDDHKIYVMRGKKVMIDRDLAELYGVETRVLNQAVRRNKNRLPEDFLFQMTSEEVQDWKSQIVISNTEKMGLRNRMKSCIGAFGIYSVNTFHCQFTDQNGMTDCENQYQIQLFAGHHYISVVNTTGTPAAQNASLLLTRKLKELLSAEEGLTLPEQFEISTDQLTGKLKFIHGELGLQNGLPDWSSYFEGLKNFNLWIRQIKTEGKDFRQALVTFDSPGDQEIFLHTASFVPSGDGWTSKEDLTKQWVVKKIGKKTIFVNVR